MNRVNARTQLSRNILWGLAETYQKHAYIKGKSQWYHRLNYGKPFLRWASSKNPESVRMSKWLDRPGCSGSVLKYSMSKAAVLRPPLRTIVVTIASPAQSSMKSNSCGHEHGAEFWHRKCVEVIFIFDIWQGSCACVCVALFRGSNIYEC